MTDQPTNKRGSTCIWVKCRADIQQCLANKNMVKNWWKALSRCRLRNDLYCLVRVVKLYSFTRMWASSWQDILGSNELWTPYTYSYIGGKLRQIFLPAQLSSSVESWQSLFPSHRWHAEMHWPLPQRNWFARHAAYIVVVVVIVIR